MSQLPCPNPACSQTFSPADVKGATALVCPRCGTKFQFRSAPPSPETSRRASGVARPPIARPVTPRPVKPPVALPAEPEMVNPNAEATEPFADTVVSSTDQASSRSPAPPAPPSFIEDSAPLVRPRYVPRRSSWLLYALLGGLTLGVAAAVVIILVVRSDSDAPEDKGGDKKTADRVINGYIRTANKDEHVFRLSLPDKTWSHDNALKKNLGASVALKRHDGQAWLAVVVKDFGGVKPRDSDLIRDAKELLEAFFGDFLELGDRIDKTELAGLSAQRLVFKGKWEPGPCRGECLMLGQRGLGYWIVLLAPTAEVVQEELAQLEGDKKRFTVVDQRTGWRERPPKMETFAATKLAVTFQAPQGVWEKFPPLADEERIDLYLAGKFLREKDNRKNASAILLTLNKHDSSKEAMTAARDWLENKKKDENKDAALVLAGGEDIPTQEEVGTIGSFGNRRGRYLELRLQSGDKPTRYLVLAVVPETDKTLVISCECSWENRLIWRQEFLDLLATLEVKSSG